MKDDDLKSRLSGFPLDEHKKATGPEPAINWEALFVIVFTFAAAYFVVYPAVRWLLG